MAGNKLVHDPATSGQHFQQEKGTARVFRYGCGAAGKDVRSQVLLGVSHQS